MKGDELRSECKKLKRKTSGNKDELKNRLLEVFHENNKGWSWSRGERCRDVRYLASGDSRDVRLQLYTKGPRKGEYCVWKVFKTGSIYEHHFFEDRNAWHSYRVPDFLINASGVGRPAEASAAMF